MSASPSFKEQQSNGTPNRTPRGGVSGASPSPNKTRGFSSSRGRSSSFNGSPNRTLGGSTLLVEGMGSPRNKLPSASYRSGSSIGDAHIKHLSQQIHKVPFKSPPGSSAAPRSSVAFGSSSGSDRDAHYKELLKRSYSNNRGAPVSWGQPGGQLSAAYRSKSPIACAHITAMTKMTDSKYVPEGSTFTREQPSASYRSKSSIADAHIKAMNKPHDSNQSMAEFGKGAKGNGASACFRSTTSIGDAHIKAIPKPADVCVAYRDEE